jgi:hypothetical protein
MSAIESFVSLHLRLAPGKTAKTTDVAAAYTIFNKSSTGKLKLYARVQAMEGVAKVRQTFTGVELIEFVNAKAPEEKTDGPKTETVVTMLDGKTPEMIRLEIELRRIALKERKAALEAMKVKDAKEMEERRAKDAKEIEEKKVLLARELKTMDEASAERLKAMDEAAARRLKEMDAEEKVKDRVFWAEQNNKNRKMYVDGERWNKYLDLKVYGTPSKQFVCSESLFDNFDFRVFDALGKVDAPARALLRDEIKSVATTVPVWEKESARPLLVVDVDRATELVDQLMEKIEASREALRESFRPVQALLERVPAIAQRDDQRAVGTAYEQRLGEQDLDRFPNMKADKRAYIREANCAYMKGAATRIRCYCCRKDISLKSSACQRSHNIPRSTGGDCSVDNVYLCCATCNADMENRYTVLEYKALLFIQELEQTRHRTEELIHAC